MAQGRGLNALKRRFKFSKRTWRIIAIAGGVVALAVVVLVSAALSKPKSKQSPEVKAVAQQMESKSLTDRGLTALSANDTATAETLLQRAVALNPQNKRATIALTQMRQSTTDGFERRRLGRLGYSGGTGSSGGSTGGSDRTRPSPTARAVRQEGRHLQAAARSPRGLHDVPAPSDRSGSSDLGRPADEGRARHLGGARPRERLCGREVHHRRRASVPTRRTLRVHRSTARARIWVPTGRATRQRCMFAAATSSRCSSVLATPSADIDQALPIARDAAVAFPDTP